MPRSTSSSPPRKSIQQIEALIAEIQLSLIPASMELVAPLLRLLIAALPAQNDEVTLVEQMAVYFIAIREFSLPAIRRAIEMIVAGKIPDMMRWLPSAPALANAVRQLEDHDRRRLARIKAELQIRRGLPAPNLSPEEEQRRAAKAEAVKAAFDAGPLKREPAWYDKPMVEEVAARPSPELIAVVKRKWHINGGSNPPAKGESHAAARST